MQNINECNQIAKENLPSLNNDWEEGLFANQSGVIVDNLYAATISKVFANIGVIK